MHMLVLVIALGFASIGPIAGEEFQRPDGSMTSQLSFLLLLRSLRSYRLPF